MIRVLRALALIATLGGCTTAATTGASEAPAMPLAGGSSVSPTADDCQPGGPCSAPIPIRVVIVAMFEIGADEGTRRGSFNSGKRGVS